MVIGHDMRDSSPGLADSFAGGVTGQGLDVVRIGLASTDQLYLASGLLNCPGAMFATASHNPAAYNGIKLCRAKAKPVGSDTGLALIREELIDGVPTYDGARGERFAIKMCWPTTPRSCGSLVDVSGTRDHRGSDAGRMAGHTAPAVLGAIPGPDPATAVFLEPDGSFPNHEANPLEPANLVDLQRHVLASGADIGLAFDGDADRCFVVDEHGDAVSPSAVTALVADRELTREPGATVIHNLITSRVVPELIAQRHGTAVRVAGRALLYQGADGADRRHLRRGAFGALLLPRLLGRRFRHAGRPTRLGRAGRAAPAIV